MEAEQTVVLTKNMLEQIIAISSENAAKVAIDKVEKERKHQVKKQQSKMLHNTKLLLTTYRDLKCNASDSVYSKTQMEESAEDILDAMMNVYDDHIIVDSIRRSATRTAIMVQHIERMLEIYEMYAKAGNCIDKRQYDVIYEMYISPEKSTVNELAKKHNCSKETIYKDIHLVIQKLSALIFGIDGIKGFRE